MAPDGPTSHEVLAQVLPWSPETDVITWGTRAQSFSLLKRLLSSEQVTSRNGIATVRFQYCAADSAG